MATGWRIELLGGLRVVRADGMFARFPTRKTELLLAYLALHPQRPHPRVTLIELLWPEILPDAGRASLRGALYALRRQLELPAPGESEGPAAPPPLLIADRTTVSLDPLSFTTDVAEFEAPLADACRAPGPREQIPCLIEAAERYQGELLPGYQEPWVVTARQHLAERCMGGLHDLVRALEQAGDRERALEYARRAVSADPQREEAHYDLMRLYAAAGQPTATLRQYQELERILREERGETPSPAVRALVEGLQQSARTHLQGSPAAVTRAAPIVGASPPNQAAPAPPLAPRSTAAVGPAAASLPAFLPPPLPVRFTRFFGREEAIAQIAAALCGPAGSPAPSGEFPAGGRLVTLTGPGGSGKTRLAIAVAGRLRESFGGGDSREATPGPGGGGVWFVPLAELTDARRLPEAVRNGMGLPAAPGGEPLEQVVAALQGAPALLILDNFEQLAAEGAPMVRRLLERVPSLSCLVTSRQRLELEGEQEFPVPPLPVPVDGSWLMVDRPARSGLADPSTKNHQLATLMLCPSIELFVDRARAARPDFRLTEANAEAVASLCQRLEGLPLAIELAAARAAVLTPQQMLARLAGSPEAGARGGSGGRFELLVSRQRDLPERHRTLWQAVEWSYQLLSPELRRFFTQLSIFRGGWTLAAAEAVCSEIELPALAFRWGGDLVPAARGPVASPATLGYLEQLQQCSLVEGVEDGPTMRYRLLETLREFAAVQLAPEEQAALARRHFLYFAPLADIKRYHDDMHRGNPDKEKEWLRVLDTEYDNLRAALSWGLQAEPGPALWLAAALASYWSIRGSWAEALAFLPRAASWRSDQWLEMAAKALLYAGDMAREVGEYQRASEWLSEAAAIGRKMGSPEMLAAARAFEGRPIHEETAADRHRRMGAAEYEAAALHHLGQMALDQGDDDRAGSLFQQSVEIRRGLWSGDHQAFGLAGLGGWRSCGVTRRPRALASRRVSLCSAGWAMRAMSRTG